MHRSKWTYHARLLCGAAAIALTAGGLAQAEEKRFDIPAQPLSTALSQWGVQSELGVFADSGLTSAKVTAGVTGEQEPETALSQILAGTGLAYRRQGEAFVIVRQGEGGSGPQSSSAGGDVDALIVTAQKREENIQDVPIAISAFSQEDLTRSQIAGGPDLMTQIPNMTFTKTNFSSYSIQIRGIGTQAISATTDPAVAVAFNNTPFIHNRFFEQEFYDLERVEVLRGPQGTLYGRNATAGVVNIISAKPKFSQEARISADLGNYGSTRLEGMVNFPLMEDAVALRLAGAWTKRDGYATNVFNGNPIDGRDLWSTRLSLRLAPTDALDATLIWEHFDEDDDRIRSGKQLCKKDPRNSIAGIPFNDSEPGVNSSAVSTYNQGCVAASLYSPESFQTPNGFSLPYVHPLKQLGLPITSGMDPYVNQNQSRDLRAIESIVDPKYNAKSDIFQAQISYDLSDNLTIQSETAYGVDEVFSTQDYNRYVTSPGIFSQIQYDCYLNGPGTSLSNVCAAPIFISKNILNNGVFCDPQIGCSDRLVAVDLSTARSRQFNQELRLSSDFDGPLNFSLGANFTRFDTMDKYYVFINSLSMWSALARDQITSTAPPYQPGVTTNDFCLTRYVLPGVVPPHHVFGDPNEVQGISCVYIDPNPIGSVNDMGHNYFLSKNPYRLISYAAFGEVYYNLLDNLKITAGFRYTVDKKHAPLIPSWLLAGKTVGYPVKKVLDLEWQEPTGRLAIDWKPDLGFTDDTLLYASYARGYKAGGANPPPMVVTADQLQGVSGAAASVVHPETFDAEFIDAFEVGTKNTLLNGTLTLNADAFYYDYKGYQISQIIDRTAVNSNFDAEIWGGEVEADWRPTDNLRFGFKGGYENTRLADGMRAVDLMDRANGGLPDENGVSWVVAKPFPSLASNCVLPVWLVTWGNQINTLFQGNELGDPGFCAKAYIAGNDPVTNLPYVANPTARRNPSYAVSGVLTIPMNGWKGLPYPGFNPLTAPNNGEGFFKDLSGNELPNAPHFTGTLTADYAVPLAGDWVVNLHGDLYYQSEAWTRVFNTEGYDKLKAYTNLNLSAIFTNEEAGWTVMAYVKNVMDRDSITGAFLNSEDSGLTTNVFLTEPRLYGIRVTKAFADVPLLGSWLGEPHEGAYPFQVELGAQVARFSSEAETYTPWWTPASLASSTTVQEEDLDWGDARDLKLTYAPDSGWRASAAWRYGKTNGSFRRGAYEPGAQWIFNRTQHFEQDNQVVTTFAASEEHTILDFMIGKDVGVGAWGEAGRSTLSAGVRYAAFQSISQVGVEGITEFFSDPVLQTDRNPKYGVTHHNLYTTTLDSTRKFEGTGPSVSWDAAVRLAGDDRGGHVDLDWTVGGGVLFGKQTTTSAEDRYGRYYYSDKAVNFISGTSTVLIDDVTPVPRSRTDRVTVPNLSLSLGLSYSIDRLKLSTGYAYDRFFDAVDGGFDAARDYDRTIQGPYVKVAIGFGG